MLELQVDTHEDGDEEEFVDAAEDLQMSLHALSGNYGKQTMKVEGFFGTQRMHILIDKGSTHNFISESTVRRLKCPLQKVQAVPVKVANGHELRCKGMIEEFKWQMQGHPF